MKVKIQAVHILEKYQTSNHFQINISTLTSIIMIRFIPSCQTYILLQIFYVVYYSYYCYCYDIALDMDNKNKMWTSKKAKKRRTAKSNIPKEFSFKWICINISVDGYVKVKVDLSCMWSYISTAMHIHTLTAHSCICIRRFTSSLVDFFYIVFFFRLLAQNLFECVCIKYKFPSKNMIKDILRYNLVLKQKLLLSWQSFKRIYTHWYVWKKEEEDTGIAGNKVRETASKRETEKGREKKNITHLNE